MKLTTVTLTGADNNTDPQDLIRLSSRFPWVEWAILLSETKAGQPRYPDKDWINSLFETQQSCQDAKPKLAAHLCGKTMRAFMKGVTFEHHDNGAWAAPHGLSESAFNRMFNRVQLNFNGRREGFTKDDYIAMIKGFHEGFDGNVITQENSSNPGLCETLQAYEQRSAGAIRSHQVLFDASGGRGVSPDSWPQPIAGLTNGYAGGISPDNAIATLHHLDGVVGRGFIWIDMETSLRNADDIFDLDRIQAMLLDIEAHSKTYGWV